MRGQAVQPGHTHIGNQAAASAPEAQHAEGFGRDGNVGCPGRHHQNISLSGPGRAEFRGRGMVAVLKTAGQDKKTGHGPVAAGGEIFKQETTLFGADACGKNGAAVAVQAVHRPHKGFIALVGGKDHFAQSGAQGALGVKGQAADAVFEGCFGKLTGGFVRFNLATGHSREKRGNVVLFHAECIRKSGKIVTPRRCSRVAK